MPYNVLENVKKDDKERKRERRLRGFKEAESGMIRRGRKIEKKSGLHELSDFITRAEGVLARGKGLAVRVERSRGNRSLRGR